MGSEPDRTWLQFQSSHMLTVCSWQAMCSFRALTFSGPGEGKNESKWADVYSAWCTVPSQVAALSLMCEEDMLTCCF